jgi:hypothetical protein
MLGLFFSLASCQTNTTGFSMGENASNTKAQGEGLEHCTAPLGRIRISEGRAPNTDPDGARLPPISVLLRAMVQESNCFVFVEAVGTEGSNSARVTTEYSRGRKAQSAAMESSPISSAADYELQPEYQFKSESPRSSGIGRVVSGLLGGNRYSSAVGALGDGVQTREVVAQMSLMDIRTRVPVVVSDSHASRTDVDKLRSGWGFGVSGYSETSQGKVVSMALMDAFNKVVVSLRARKKIS